MEIGVAAALVLIAFLFVARFNASTGTVTVTVNMSAFSPPLVKVGSPATTTLSATIGSNYNPPVPSPDEGSLSDTYKWTLTLLFSPTASGTYSSAGAPGTQNYYLSPKPLPSSGTIPVTLTPERPGYWEPSASCTVTVKDSKNANLTWTGSGNAGLAKLTSYILQIQYGGTDLDGKTQDVSVGEQVTLSAKYGPSDMLLFWSPAGSVISGYTANNSSAKITPLGSTAEARPTLSYYWMDTDSGSTENENVTLTGTIPDSFKEVSANTTFSVYRPRPSFTTQYLGPVALDTYYKGAPGVLTLHDGDEAGTKNDPGIELNFSIPTSQFGGIPNLSTVQITDRLTVTTEQYNKSTKTVTTFEYTIPNSAVPAPALDTDFPYWNSYPTASAGGVAPYAYCFDAPSYGVDPPPAGSGFGPGNWSTYQVTISETFTHNLLFTPTVPSGISSIYAPLSQVSWGWDAVADNPNNGGFTLANPQQEPASPPHGSDLPSLPQWNSNAKPSWNNPQWFAAY